MRRKGSLRGARLARDPMRDTSVPTLRRPGVVGSARSTTPYAASLCRSLYMSRWCLAGVPRCERQPRAETRRETRQHGARGTQRRRARRATDAREIEALRTWPRKRRKSRACTPVPPALARRCGGQPRGGGRDAPRWAVVAQRARGRDAAFVEAMIADAAHPWTLLALTSSNRRQWRWCHPRRRSAARSPRCAEGACALPCPALVCPPSPDRSSGLHAAHVHQLHVATPPPPASARARRVSFQLLECMHASALTNCRSACMRAPSLPKLPRLCLCALLLLLTHRSYRARQPYIRLMECMRSPSPTDGVHACERGSLTSDFARTLNT